MAVSAGNTGALMAMARFHLRTMPRHRPAGHCRRVADGARRVRRARSRRHHRRRRASSGVARDHGQRDGAACCSIWSVRRSACSISASRKSRAARKSARPPELLRAMNLPQLDYHRLRRGRRHRRGRGRRDRHGRLQRQHRAQGRRGHRAPDGGISAQCHGAHLALQDRLSVRRAAPSRRCATRWIPNKSNGGGVSRPERRRRQEPRRHQRRRLRLRGGCWL